jgi:hypothetical protein
MLQQAFGKNYQILDCEGSDMIPDKFEASVESVYGGSRDAFLGSGGIGLRLIDGEFTDDFNLRADDFF